MTDPNPPYRHATAHDLPCIVCKEPMVGIMRVSRIPPYEPPRKICYSCCNEQRKDTAA